MKSERANCGQNGFVVVRLQTARGGSALGNESIYLLNQYIDQIK